MSPKDDVKPKSYFYTRDSPEVYLERSVLKENFIAMFCPLFILVMYKKKYYTLNIII